MDENDAGKRAREYRTFMLLAPPADKGLPEFTQQLNLNERLARRVVELEMNVERLLNIIEDAIDRGAL